MKFIHKTSILLVTGAMFHGEHHASGQSCTPGTIPVINDLRRIKPNVSASHDRYGTSVGISGDWAVAGAIETGGQSLERGFAIIHQRHQFGLDQWGEWIRLTSPQNLTDQEGDQFGIASAISGDYIIVGAHLDSIGGVLNEAGSAYIFERNLGGTENWGLAATLEPQSDVPGQPGEVVFDRFGAAVAISGDLAIVGAHFDNTSAGGVDAGSAYIYRRDGNGVWQFETKITASDGALLDEFGFSVDIDRDPVSGRDVAVVGAPLDDNERAVDAGTAYVFRRDPNAQPPAWSQEQRIIAPINTNVGAESEVFVSSQFGFDVACWPDVATNSDQIVVGAPFHALCGPVLPNVQCPCVDLNNPGTTYGTVYVFLGNHAAGWDMGIWLIPQGCLPSTKFGRAVDIENGVVAFSSNKGPDAGHVYEQVGTGNTWNELLTLDDLSATGPSRFGNALALSEGTIIVGADEETESSLTKTGRSYVFNGMRDCDANGSFDAVEICLGTGGDCNNNWNLDVCGEIFGCFGDIRPVDSTCPGGTGNGTVNTDDLVELLGAFGSCPAPPTACPADIAPPGPPVGNGVVNIDDLVALLGAFGPCGTGGASGMSGVLVLEQMDFSNGFTFADGTIDAASSTLVAAAWIENQNGSMPVDVFRLFVNTNDSQLALTFAGGSVAGGAGGTSEPLVLSPGKNASFFVSNGNYASGVDVALLAIDGGPGQDFQSQAWGTYLFFGTVTSSPARMGDLAALDAILTGAVNDPNTGWGVFGAAPGQGLIPDGNGGWKILIGQFTVPQGKTFTAAVRLAGDGIDVYATINSGS